MLAAIAFCPSAPVLVPELAAGAAAELDRLRRGCDAAVRAVVAAGVDQIIVLAAGPREAEYAGTAGGTLAGFGVDVRTGGSASWRLEAGRPEGRTSAALPASLTIGAWILDRVAPQSTGIRRLYQEVREDAPPSDIRRAARALAAARGNSAVLALGEGSAWRPESPGGYSDPRSQEYDEGVAEALARGDIRALAAVDPIAAQLEASGRSVWPVVAEAMRMQEAPVRAELIDYQAPYGVTYFVAVWLADGPPGSGRVAAP